MVPHMEWQWCHVTLLFPRPAVFSIHRASVADRTLRAHRSSSTFLTLAENVLSFIHVVYSPVERAMYLSPAVYDNKGKSGRVLKLMGVDLVREKTLELNFN